MMEPRSGYVPESPFGPHGYSDRARRASDTVNLHVAAASDKLSVFGKWVAIRLSDGGSDNVLYDTKQDAVRHQLHETQCAYVRIPLGGMPPREAEIFLAFNEQAYDAGFRLSDPLTLHMPQTSRLETFR